MSSDLLAKKVQVLIKLREYKIVEKDEVKEFDAIMMKNTISEQSWIWNPSHKDLIADDYIEVKEKKKEK